MDEFEIIKKYVKPISNKGEILLGKGDDCSIVDYSESQYLVQTTDCLVENIHFRCDFMTASEIAYKSIAVNISDISAMGGQGKWCHLSLALPERMGTSWVESFFKTFNELLKLQGIKLLGGDLSRSPHDIFINLHLCGLVGKNEIKKRAGLGEVSKLFVSRPLGDSSSGLFCLEKKITEFEDLVFRHKHPPIETPRALWLSTRKEVLGMMDLSDGLLSDLKRIPQGGIKINLEKIPHSKELLKFCELTNKNPFEFSLAGGEDYALLLSCKKGHETKLQKDFEEKFQSPLFEIGTVEKGENEIGFFENGVETYIDLKSFSHFRS